MERAVLKRLAPLLFLLGLLVAAGPSATATAADGCSRTGEYDDKGHEIVDCSASENTESTAEEVGDPRGSGSGTTECWFMGELLPSCKGPNGSTWNGTCYQGAPLPQFDEHPPEGLQIPEDGRWHECHAPPGFPLEPYGCPSGMGNRRRKRRIKQRRRRGHSGISQEPDNHVGNLKKSGLFGFDPSHPVIVAIQTGFNRKNGEKGNAGPFS
jgi:hypothetical protein